MSIVRTVGPAVEPITVAEAMEQVQTSFAGDAGRVAAFIASARSYVERLTGRSLITQQWRLQLQSWYGSNQYTHDKYHFVYSYHNAQNCIHYIELPRSPLISVQSVKYWDSNNAQQTLSTSDYIVDSDSIPGRIQLAPGASWPDLAQRVDAVQVNFTAGHGDTPASIPEDLKHAVRFCVRHYFDTPFAVAMERGVVPANIPHTLSDLIEGYRVEFIA